MTCYNLRLPDPLPIEHSQLQLSLATQTTCLGKFSRWRVSGCSLYPLIADGVGIDPIVPKNRLGKRLRVHDDVIVAKDL